jgi:hypothetical protein
LTLILATALSAAGVIHCLLSGEHMAMTALFGAGFLAAGVAQVGMAGLAMVRPSRMLYVAVVASTAVLSSMYAYNVFVGLPFQEDAEAPAGISAEHSEGDAQEVEHAADSQHADETAGHDESPVQIDHHEGGLALGGGEPVDAFGAVTQAAQLTAAAVALALLRRSRQAEA